MRQAHCDNVFILLINDNLAQGRVLGGINVNWRGLDHIRQIYHIDQACLVAIVQLGRVGRERQAQHGQVVLVNCELALSERLLWALSLVY